jgi:probable rRNA maturation factor
MPSQQSALLFQVATPGLSRRSLRAFVKRLETEVAGDRVFCCLIAGDEELQRLNREFRKRDYATDVLSFPISSLPSRPSTVRVGQASGLSRQAGGLPYADGAGEIAISYHAARRQSVEHGHKVQQEIEILMLHGVLHLLGLDHETDHGRMLSVERKWRVRLGLPAGLIERASA